MRRRALRCWRRSASTLSSGSRSQATVDELRRRHADYFLRLAEEAEPNLRGSPGDWLDRLEAEHDNFRAALDRLEASGESETALRLAAALWRFWYLEGHLAEGRRRLESALLADERPTAARAKALNGAAVMAVNTGDSATAKLRAEEGLALHRTLGDRWGAAYAGFMLGNAASEGGDWWMRKRCSRRACESSVSSATSTPPGSRPQPCRAYYEAGDPDALERSARTTSVGHGRRTTNASRRARSVCWRRLPSRKAGSRMRPRC